MTEDLTELRARLVESLRPFCSEPEEAVSHLEEFWERFDRTTADFTPAEAELVRIARLNPLALDSPDQNFAEMLDIEVSLRKTFGANRDL